MFLLRFFHGYLPSEIASLTRLSSAIVDALVLRARREVKVYVEDPRQLAFIDGREATEPAATVRPTVARLGADPSAHAFVHELRERIFHDTHRSCWSKTALRERYRDPSAETLSRDDLAGLVSCRDCLDAANALLGLPQLAERRRPPVNVTRAFQFAGDDFPMFAPVRRYLRHQLQFQRAERGATGRTSSTTQPWTRTRVASRPPCWSGPGVHRNTPGR